MDASANAVRGQEQNGTGEGVEPGSLASVRRQIEAVKAGLRDDPGRAYSVEFTAAEILREHDPVQFNSLRRLLKDKQVRLGEFDRLIEHRRRERVERSKRNKTVAAARISRTAHAIVGALRTVGGGVQVGRYVANAQGLFLLKSIGRGVPPIKLPLANFRARIVAEIRRDDGVDSTREFEIEARLGGQTRRLVIAAAQFASMKWVTEQLGARTVIAAGMGIKDQVREAIQLLSATQMAERTVHTHTGWRKLDGGWAYLQGGGALGAKGAVIEVETSLPAALASFILPAPPTAAELRSAIRASLAVLDLAPDRVTVPTLGAVWRGNTLFAVVPHPVAHGLSRDYFFGVGRMLASTRNVRDSLLVAPRPISPSDKPAPLETLDHNKIVWSGDKNRRKDYFQGVILSSDTVRLLVAPSDRPGARGASLQRKAKAYVKAPLTVEDYLRRGLRKDDLAWDYQREFLSIVDETGTEIREDQRRASVAMYLTTRGN